MSAATYLDEILAAHRADARHDRRDPEALMSAAVAGPPVRPFTAALTAADGLAVIAEIKRRSPSRGDLDPDLDPATVAAEYEAGGAVVSVGADRRAVLRGLGRRPGGRRGGPARCRCCARTSRSSRPTWPTPGLMGADAVLLIVAALSDGELGDLLGLAGRLGLDALVEAHDEDEVERALAAGATLVGVNQRDLTTFEVDQERALRVIRAIPADVVAVAESGIGSADDARRLAAAGYRAVLVGETLVRAGDRRRTLRDLAGHAVGQAGRVGS